MGTQEKKRSEWLDKLRLIAMLAVILNHCLGTFSYTYYDQYVGTSWFYIDNFLNCATRFNVPVFLLLSGALMLSSDKYSDINNCVRKAVMGGVLPLAVWTVIYTAVNSMLTGENFIKNLCLSVAGAQPYCGHLWFMYTIIVFYILTPLLQAVIKADDSYVNLMLVLWVIYAVCFGMVKHFTNHNIYGYWYINITAGYLGWYILGYKLYHLKRSFNRGLLRFVFFVSEIMTGVFVLVSQKIVGGFDVYFHDFLSPTVIVAATSLFLIFREGSEENRESGKIVSLFAVASMEIYFVHFMIRDIFLNLFSKGVWNEMQYFILTPVLTIALSCMAGYLITIIKKKVVSKIVGA